MSLPHELRNRGLPVLEEIRWGGFVMDFEAEADVFHERRAMARAGWSEDRWRFWIRELQAELQRRERWWELVQQWSTERWDGISTGKTEIQERLRELMFKEELEQRLSWNIKMRHHCEFGEPSREWWKRWKFHYRFHLGEAGEYTEESSAEEGEYLAKVWRGRR